MPISRSPMAYVVSLIVSNGSKPIPRAISLISHKFVISPHKLTKTSFALTKLTPKCDDRISISQSSMYYAYYVLNTRL